MRIDRWITTAAVLGCFAFTAVGRAEDDEKKAKSVSLPKAVEKSLKAKYPGAKIRNVGKEKNAEGETIYEVEMTVATPVDVNFDAKGEIEAIERGIGIFELPEVVRKVATKAFPKGKIVKAETIVEEEGELNYEVVIELKGKKPFELVMAGNGKILKDGSKPAKGAKAKAKTEKEEEEDEDDDKPKAKGKKSEKDEDEDDDKPKAKKAEKGEKAEAKKGEKEEEDEDEDDDKPKAKKAEKGEKKAEAKKAEKEDEDEDDDKPKAKKAEKGEKSEAKAKKAEKDEDEDDDDDKGKGKGKKAEKEEDDD
jgi:hypothetical protein